MYSSTTKTLTGEITAYNDFEFDNFSFTDEQCTILKEVVPIWRDLGTDTGGHIVKCASHDMVFNYPIQFIKPENRDFSQ